MHATKKHTGSITAWLIVALLCSGASSDAAEIPAPGDGDQRVRYVTYQKDEVTKVTVRRGVVTRIVLGDDERIVIAGSGFLADCAKPEAEWCIRADVGTNQVWVKPKDHATHNNLEIRTDKRDYSLEFTVVGDHRVERKQNAGQGQHGKDEPMYRVIFRHPLVPPNPAAMTAMQASAHRAKHARDKADLLTERLNSFVPEPRNWSYSMEVLPGGEDISPTLVFDDGRFTYFLFPPNREIPAIFYFSPLGEETRINFHMEKDLAVVQRMGRRFVLRLGDAVVGIWNDAYDKTGVPAIEGTTVSGITRTLRCETNMEHSQESRERAEQKPPIVDGIVSVNHQAGGRNETAARVAFLVVMAIVVVVGLVFAANTYSAKRKAEATNEQRAAKVENKPAQIGLKRVFETDPFPPQHTTALVRSTSPSPVTSADHVMGSPRDRGIDEGSRPMALGPDQTQDNHSLGRRSSSRFGGEVLVTNSPASDSPRTQQAGTGPDAAISLVRELLNGARQPETGSGSMLGGSAMPVSTAADAGSSTPSSIGYMGGPSGPSIGVTSVGLAAPPGPAASGAGLIGGLLTPSDTPRVQAGLLGDRNLILPKGRTIDCALTVRVINEVAGMATCVLNSDVYSDNGRVVLLERGSEAVGEYAATMAQGQRRLFLLWTRVKTPTGVVINLNSPAADALGTSGLVGHVDNHWWDRLGAAFLLSLVQDGIGLATATQAGGGGAQSLGIYQHSATTGNRMAELILQSTINIKPTLYKNQGDRGTIFVARDLDFSTVYELHPH